MLESSSAYSGKAHKPSQQADMLVIFIFLFFFICIFLNLHLVELIVKH